MTAMGKVSVVVVALLLVLGLALWIAALEIGGEVTESVSSISGVEYANLSDEQLRGRLMSVGYGELEVDRALVMREHSSNVDSFYMTVKAASSDSVVSSAEHQDLCFKLPQWRDQLTAARAYVREHGVETVRTTPSLYRLGVLVEEGMAGLELIQASCP